MHWNLNSEYWRTCISEPFSRLNFWTIWDWLVSSKAVENFSKFSVDFRLNPPRAKRSSETDPFCRLSAPSHWRLTRYVDRAERSIHFRCRFVLISKWNCDKWSLCVPKHPGGLFNKENSKSNLLLITAGDMSTELRNAYHKDQINSSFAI